MIRRTAIRLPGIRRVPHNSSSHRDGSCLADDRLPNGWAYGTYAYSNNPTKGSKRGATPWTRIGPIGLQWGNDPGITPSMVKAGVELRESWLHPKADISVLPDNHRRWGGRLVGPLDNRDSSCMSCHQTAGQPAFALVAPTTNKGTNDEQGQGYERARPTLFVRQHTRGRCVWHER